MALHTERGWTGKPADTIVDKACAGTVEGLRSLSFQLVLVGTSLLGFLGASDDWGPLFGGPIAPVLLLVALVWHCVHTREGEKRPHIASSTMATSSLVMLVAVVLPGLIASRSDLEFEDELTAELLHDVGPSIWLVAFGLAVSVLFYERVAGRPRTFLDLGDRVLLPSRLKRAYCAALALSASNIALRGRSIDGRSALPVGLEQLDRVLAFSGPVMLLSIAELARRRTRAEHLAARWMVVGAVLVGFADGFFKPSLWALMAYGFGALWREVSPKANPQFARRLLLSGLCALAVLVAVVPLVQESRANKRSSSPIAALTGAYDQSWGRGWDAGLNIFMEKAFGRQAGTLVGLVRVADRSPRTVPYKGLDHLALTPIYLMPRSIWPSKPELSSGIDVSVLFYDAPADTRTSNTLTLYGDGYWYSGLLGVGLVAGAAGALIGLIDSVFHRGAGIATRIALLPSALIWEADFQPWIVGVVQDAFIMAIIAYSLSLSTGVGSPDDSRT